MKEINALELRKRFGEVMDQVRYGKEPWIVKKNGQPVIVLMDISTFKASQENLGEEAFIEEYSEERFKEFLTEDKLDKATREAAKKSLHL